MKEQDVLDSTIFLTVSGSYAYGTSHPESDLDRRGVCVPRNKALYFGMPRHNFEQKDSWESQGDLVIYDLRKAVDLMLACNPNMIELLFIRESEWEIAEPAWLQLQEQRDKFLSKKARHTFGGYAFAQLKRIKHHRAYLLDPPKGRPQRADFGLPENRNISNDDLQAFLWMVTTLLRNSIEMMNLSETTKLELASVNFFGLVQGKLGEHGEQEAEVAKKLTGMPDGFVDVCMREKRYMSALKQYESYEKWKKERNPKRAETERRFGLDTKHAMHLVRLLRMGIEILRDKKVNVWRADREELLEIRNGKWSYEQLEEYAHMCDKELARLYHTSSLPDSPATAEIEKLCIDIVEQQVNGASIHTSFHS